MYPKKIVVSEQCVEIYNNVFSSFLLLIEKYKNEKDNFLRYSFHGENKLYYFYASDENNSEQQSFSVKLKNDYHDVVNNVIQYQKLLDIDKKHRITFHINYYPVNNFNYIKNSKLNRMPFHQDSSKFTMVHQNEKGIFIKNHPRIHSTINEIVMFRGEMEHKVEMSNKERFSLSTFIF